MLAFFSMCECESVDTIDFVLLSHVVMYNL